MADASSASMFSGFITSGNAGAAVYGVTFKMEIFGIGQYRGGAARSPQGFLLSKRVPWLQETVACSWQPKSPGIQGLQSHPTLKKKLYFVVYSNHSQGNFLPLSRFSRCWKILIWSTSFLTIPASIFFTTATVSFSLHIKKKVDFIRRTIRNTSVILIDAEYPFWNSQATRKISVFQSGPTMQWPMELLNSKGEKT